MNVKKVKLMMSCIMMTVIVQLFSCGGDEEKPQTLPVVKTLTAVSSGPNSGTATGEITSDGNASITEAGFVYSLASLPTINDGKEEVTDFDEFTAELTGLTSGTVYNVRAYAINKKGVAYGEEMTFETGNLAPVASNVTITGTVQVASILTADHTYTDAEGDDEGTSAYQWYAANDAAGAGETSIDGATSETFEIQDAQQGKFIRVGVTPKAVEGTLVGLEVKSNFTTAVGAETVTSTYNDLPVTYGVIKSELTGRKWLDRNLGASRVAQSVTDYEAYGDMVQWGRLTDGHQLVIRTNGTDAGVTGVTGTSSETTDQDVPPVNTFIMNSSTRGDWRSPQNSNLWQGVNGTNNPCPSGWRIATEDEWLAEGITSLQDGYEKLKLTYTGSRDLIYGTFTNTETFGRYWSSTVKDSRLRYAVQISLDASATTIENNRAYGVACRCIKD